MGSLRSLRSESVDVEKVKIERKLKEYRETIKYLLSAFEATGVPRNKQVEERTLEENYLGMYEALVEAYEGEYHPGLPGVLKRFSVETFKYEDHFAIYQLEYGEDLEPRGAVYVMDEKALEIAVLILSRKIKHWDKENISALKYMRDDLKSAMKGIFTYCDRDIDDVVKRESIPTAPFPHLMRDTDIVAVDKQGRCLIPEIVENVWMTDDLV